MSEIEELREAVIDGRAKVAAVKVAEALAAGSSPEFILHDVLMDAMAEVGQLFESGEIFVPEMLVAARAMDAALVVLKPHLVDEDTQQKAKVVIGTVKGDLHDIGKNLVIMMLKGAGYQVTDLGVDVEAERFVDAARETGAQVVALSALLTTTMVNMKPVIDAFVGAGMRDKVRLIVGGAPITQTYAEQIGADGYRAEASNVVALVDELLESA